MWTTALLTFFAGVFAANATPHFVKGITKEPFPTPFGYTPLINLVAGWGMYVIAALLLAGADVAARPWPAAVSGAIGVLVMGVFHAHVGAFGKRPPAKAAPLA
ncbi:hypothetical protein GCM10010149_51220 [Nonomuraea roseoviolacea subsp. roseoviolacea]|uniref:Uncharacterized protein n=1 Tax=Nonomuraea roseoviolacea subsp. carminata TaxID=160689 RepID=A0ABT1K0N9_9ACTN|nr:hypothetical protein [Nonomuraea roseoviolacea]MCP2347555.1 hypothetical protein [Nonomuraea roseoviolacea subsp. carminata]